ncbi:ribosome assembly RNA-binding protein YhbY [Alteromonas oceanisediminis]|uniref:ribosome assembly RNA-binding protein YhbY n=1 Tax=Alteromonas oceanisediminis TaxID=2836180 RepID=UPI001BDB50ED|nr:ribosome assembly RNA-binding protein YhbY [Alteromonas oceanisediminis]MBT0586521.1 ribosome assembly RNA-binding protein YhbY [Alteromonas oceanisediminis]
MNLSTKQKQFLKGLAHDKKPVVQLGNNGLTEGVMAEIDNALNFHELIKVKIPTDDREEKSLIADAIVRETGAVKIQVIGHTLILFKQSDEQKITLPRR